MRVKDVQRKSAVIHHANLDKEESWSCVGTRLSEFVNLLGFSQKKEVCFTLKLNLISFLAYLQISQIL